MPPMSHDPRMAQAQAHAARGEHAQALAILQGVLRSRPRDASVLSELGRVCMLGGRSEQAEGYARAALSLRQDDPVLTTNLALVLLNHAACTPAKRSEAVSLLRKATTTAPAYADAQVLLVQALVEDTKIGDAHQACIAAAAHVQDPDLAVYHALCESFLGASRAALARLDRAASVWPQHPVPKLARCVLSHTVPGLTPATIAAWHAEYGSAIAKTIARPPAHVRSTPRARLRVGVLSPDLRRHSVAYFARPLFEHLDPAKFELYAYHLWAKEDDVSQQLRTHAARWTNVAMLTDEAIAGMIARDDLDILLDLGGLTSGSRPRVLAARPVPIIATYCGYPDTTGIPGVTHRIVDALTDPPSTAAGPSFDARCVEKLVRLNSCFLCYTPPTDAPDARPVASRGEVRFASFNSVRKLNIETFQLWARVLNAVPSSTLTLKWGDLQDQSVRQSVEVMLGAAGIADRTTILPRSTDTASHLACYHDVDIALDTCPYHGTTTTCEAMWMGVPVVTRVGEIHASRVGLSLLTQVGLEDLACVDDDAFVATAARLARDADRRAMLRAGLRERMATSPLCNPTSFAARFGEVLLSLAARSEHARDGTSTP